LEAVRELVNMVADLVEKNLKDMENHATAIKKLKEEAAERKRLLLRELAESGMLLLNREDFLRLAVQVGEIADLCEGAAYRIVYIAKHKIKLTDELREGLFSLSKNVLKTVTNLRETILSLSYSRQRAIEMSKNVEVAEYAVDEMYREIEIRIIEADLDIGSTLILWSLAGLLEDISDKAEDAIDSTRVLALGV
jgi:predicted phosphate transport protein (TIGR00153 family)